MNELKKRNHTQHFCTDSCFNYLYVHKASRHPGEGNDASWMTQAWGSQTSAPHTPRVILLFLLAVFSAVGWKACGKHQLLPFSVAHQTIFQLNNWPKVFPLVSQWNSPYGRLEQFRGFRHTEPFSAKMSCVFPLLFLFSSIELLWILVQIQAVKL